MDINFEVSRYTQDKHPDSHMHEQYEIFISLSDEGTFFVREEGYPLRFGMVSVMETRNMTDMLSTFRKNI